jgi:hypothetical protein
MQCMLTVAVYVDGYTYRWRDRCHHCTAAVAVLLCVGCEHPQMGLWAVVLLLQLLLHCLNLCL